MRPGRRQEHDPARFCAKCGRRLVRKRYGVRLEDRTAFLRRKTCGGRGVVPGHPGANKKNACKYIPPGNHGKRGGHYTAFQEGR